MHNNATNNNDAINVAHISYVNEELLGSAYSSFRQHLLNHLVEVGESWRGPPSHKALSHSFRIFYSEQNWFK